MTGILIQMTMPGMARKPGRQQVTPLEFKLALARRVWRARDRMRAPDGSRVSTTEMARRLTEIVGREISADTYRKYELPDDKSDEDGADMQLSLLPQDLILPFCDVTHVHPYELLAAAPFSAQRNNGSQPKERSAA